ncbi:MAG: flavodoxin family protein [Candidatus Bathyarchaeota archaeon]|nr:flavodoxin family protein [Candidatus Bathyarchaeota archaeon]
MKIMIIYDSVFGNTEKIAKSMEVSLEAQEVKMIRVSNVTPDQLTGVQLLVVGSPTRGFRPTKPTTDFLKKIPSNGLKGVKVAAFDTRITIDEKVPLILRFLSNIFGYAAKPIADKLTEKGGELIMPPEGFIVKGSEGPLKEGEFERATDWAKQIIKP